MRDRGIGAFALALSLCGPVEASCRLALQLGLDISSSVSTEEDRLQRGGLARAMLSADVRGAFLAGPGHVALSVFEWSGRYQQDEVLPWTLIRSAAELDDAAETIRSSARSYAEFPTAAGFAVDYAIAQFENAPACDAQTLDLSGDGINNDGPSPRVSHGDPRLKGTIINGLIIGGATDRREDDLDLFRFYKAEVIFGPGAFVEAAENYADFTHAMRRKLLRELAVPVLGAVALP